MKADNISNSVDTILDLVVGKKDKTGTRPSGKDAKYNKSTIKRLLTVDPPEAGVRAAGRLGFIFSKKVLMLLVFLLKSNQILVLIDYS